MWPSTMHPGTPDRRQRNREIAEKAIRRLHELQQLEPADHIEESIQFIERWRRFVDESGDVTLCA